MTPLSQNIPETLSASQPAAISLPYHPPAPFQQSPPSAPAFSDDSEPLPVGHVVLAEGSHSLAPSITQSPITISPSGYNSRPPIEQSNSTAHTSRLHALTLTDTSDSQLHVSLSFNSGFEALPESSDNVSVSAFTGRPASEYCIVDYLNSNQNMELIVNYLGRLFHGISPAGLPESSLPIESEPQGLVPSSQTNIDVDTRPPPNPFVSTLARDAILTYAYRLYQSKRNPGATSILSAIPVFNLPDMTSLEHVNSSQLIPLLTTLRSLHPHHLPTLLLLGSVYYAMDDYATSLSLNEEILSIDPGYVGTILSHDHAEWSNSSPLCSG